MWLRAIEAEGHQSLHVGHLSVLTESDHLLGVLFRPFAPIAQRRSFEVTVQTAYVARIGEHAQERQPEPPVQQAVVHLVVVPLEAAVAGLVALAGVIQVFGHPEEISQRVSSGIPEDALDEVAYDRSAVGVDGSQSLRETRPVDE